MRIRKKKHRKSRKTQHRKHQNCDFSVGGLRLVQIDPSRQVSIDNTRPKCWELGKINNLQKPKKTLNISKSTPHSYHHMPGSIYVHAILRYRAPRGTYGPMELMSPTSIQSLTV